MIQHLPSVDAGYTTLPNWTPAWFSSGNFWRALENRRIMPVGCQTNSSVIFTRGPIISRVNKYNHQSKSALLLPGRPKRSMRNPRHHLRKKMTRSSGPATLLLLGKPTSDYLHCWNRAGIYLYCFTWRHKWKINRKKVSPLLAAALPEKWCTVILLLREVKDKRYPVKEFWQAKCIFPALFAGMGSLKTNELIAQSQVLLKQLILT